MLPFLQTDTLVTNPSKTDRGDKPSYVAFLPMKFGAKGLPTKTALRSLQKVDSTGFPFMPQGEGIL